MLCQEIIETLEARYPGSCAMDWDNVGLLVGRRKKEVHRIYVAVDATDEVIEEAIEAQADMLVTHHPMIFSGMKQITEDDFISSFPTADFISMTAWILSPTKTSASGENP